MEKKKPRFCVMGAGHGGTAMAAHLALKGFEVNLYNRSEERLIPIRERGNIELLAPGLDDVQGGLGQIRVATTDAGEALSDVDIVMVVVPATAHSFMARAAAPHLCDGQIVVLHPGRTGGALEFRHLITEAGCTADVLIGEAQTFIYASRATQPAQVRIFSVKNSIPAAAIPSYRTSELITALRVAYPQFVPGDNVLKTSLNNVGVIFHPTVLVMNAGRVEDTHGDFQYYLQGITPSVAQVLEEMDRERVRLGDALGIGVMSARNWLFVAYSAAGSNLHEAIAANPGYKGIMAPPTVAHRYILEDVPTGLVPMVSLGKMLGVEMPTMEGVIQLTSCLVGRDLRAEGRTVENLGLSGLTIRQIQRLVMEGEPHEPS